MVPYLIVFAGADLGGMARHAVNMATARLGYAFPWGTLAVNVAGSFLMGVLTAWFALRTGMPQHLRFFLTTGVLGGFTTFSAFSLDVALMWEKGAFGPAAVYVLGSVVLSVAGLFAGMAAVRLLA
jgi:CrcB protein